MWKTLSILFRIDAHTSVVQHALFTSIVQCQVNGYAYICNWYFAYSALCILRGGWEGRFFEKHSIIPSIYAQQIVLNRPPRTLHKTNYAIQFANKSNALQKGWLLCSCSLLLVFIIFSNNETCVRRISLLTKHTNSVFCLMKVFHHAEFIDFRY